MSGTEFAIFGENSVFNGCSLKDVQKTEVDLLKKFVLACEKLGLNFYITGGTLLGAVRHKGFVPWDDDIDIDMPRADYEKLCRAAKNEFCKLYFFQTFESDKGYFSGHAKLRNCDTTFEVEGDEFFSYNKGIFMDIFPLDNVPDNALLRKIFFMASAFFKELFEFGLEKNRASKLGRRGKIMRKFSLLLYAIFGQKALFRKYENFCSKYKNKKTSFMAPIAFLPKKRNLLWNKSLYEKTQSAQFEGVQVQIPCGFETILQRLYGTDFMTPKKMPSIHKAKYVSLENGAWIEGWKKERE